MEPKRNQSTYFRWGLTLLLVVVASIIVAVIFTNLTGFFAVISSAIKIISPLIYGAVFSYLLNPLVKLADNFMRPRLQKKMKKPEKAGKLSRSLSIVFALLILGIIVYGFFYLVLPQLYETILSIADNMPKYLRTGEAWLMRVLEDNPDLRATANSALKKLTDSVETWINEDLISNMGSLMDVLTNSVVAVFKEIVSILIGLVASIYILASKESFLGTTKKLIVGVCRRKTADRLLYVGRETHRVFSGFIMGKLIDSLIIGILCYIGMQILRLPFPMLIATIVGITNVIPFFGPIIGAVPSAILILLVDPLKAVYFVIFVLVLQQLDGNIIGPRILGDTIGISGFWVLISITVAGNLFGFGGMLLGVPVFAILHSLVRESLAKCLARKDLPAETEAYCQLQYVSELHGGAESDEPEGSEENESE